MNSSDRTTTPPSQTTVEEYKRVLQLIDDVGLEPDPKGFYPDCILEGIHHPITMVKWLAPLHMLLKETASQVEIAKIFQYRPNQVGQQRAKREERLSLLQVRGKVKPENYFL